MRVVWEVRVSVGRDGVLLTASLQETLVQDATKGAPATLTELQEGRYAPGE